MDHFEYTRGVPLTDPIKLRQKSMPVNRLRKIWGDDRGR